MESHDFFKNIIIAGYTLLFLPGSTVVVHHDIVSTLLAPLWGVVVGTKKELWWMFLGTMDLCQVHQYIDLIIYVTEHAMLGSKLTKLKYLSEFSTDLHQTFRTGLIFLRW